VPKKRTTLRPRGQVRRATATLKGKGKGEVHHAGADLGGQGSMVADAQVIHAAAARMAGEGTMRAKGHDAPDDWLRTLAQKGGRKPILSHDEVTDLQAKVRPLIRELQKRPLKRDRELFVNIVIEHIGDRLSPIEIERQIVNPVINEVFPLRRK